MKKSPYISKLFLLLVIIICATLPVQAVFSAVVNTDHVKMYAEPNPAAPVIETLKLGDVVKAYGKSADGQFMEAEHKGHHGWIMFKHVSPKDHRYSVDSDNISEK